MIRLRTRIALVEHAAREQQERFMTHKLDTWSHPRPYTDACHRRRKYGAVQPMQREGFWARLFKCERSR